MSGRRPRRGRARVHLGSLAVALAATAFAQESAPGVGAAQIFEAMTVVASKVEEPVGRPAGFVTVIDRSQIERQQVQTMSDLVRYEPGVSATGQVGRFGFASFRIRGVDGNRVAVELDGERLPDGFAVGSFANAGRGETEPELLRSVEILRGPASAMHGSDALGGVVAMTTLAPSDLLAGGGDRAAEIHVGGDSRDGGRRLSLLGATARAGWQALALLATRDGHEVANRGDVAPDPATSRRRSAFAHLVRSFDAALVGLVVERHEQSLTTDVRHLVHGPAQFATTESLRGDDRDRRSRVALDLELAASRRWLSEGRGRVFWSTTQTVQETAQRRGPDVRTPAPTLRHRRFDLAHKITGGEWTATTRFATGDVDHRLTWGLQLDEATIRERRDGSETNLGTGATTPVVLGENLPVRDFPVSRLRRLGIYASDEIALAGGRWRLQPALRFDRTASRGRADTLYREDFPDTEVVDSALSSWTPRIGLIRELGHGHSVYLQYAEGFRAPPFYDTNVGLRIATFNYEAIPNPDLRPESSRGVELGWRFASRPVAAQVAVFDNRYRDLIESRANLGPDPITGTTLFQSVNRDRARIHGVDGRLRFDLAALSERARGVTVDAGLSWARGEDTRRREPLNSIDPATLTLGVGYSSRGGDWSVSAMATWVDSKRGKVDDSRADVFAPPAHAQLDLHGEWRPRAAIALTAAMLNVFDRKYWSYGNVRGVLAGDPQLDFYSEPGRGIVIGIGWRR